jgi:hypothetical protein
MSFVLLKHGLLGGTRCTAEVFDYTTSQRELPGGLSHELVHHGEHFVPRGHIGRLQTSLRMKCAGDDVEALQNIYINLNMSDAH